MRSFIESAPGRFRLILILVSVLLLAGCGRTSSPPTVALPIYFTCDTDGRLEPCGCFTGQYGGMSRLKTVLDAEAPPESLRVDIGNAAGGHQDFDLIEYEFMLSAFAAMKFDALNIGQREAQFSAGQLRGIKSATPVPIVSANLLDAASGLPIFGSYRIVQRGAFRIAIIGVVDPRGMDGKPGSGVAVGDMESAIDRSLTELRGKADMVVLLAFTNEATLTKLAQEYYECQVILGGKVAQPAQQLVTENRSLIYYVTNESRALGILNLKLTQGAPVQATSNEIRLMRDTIPQDPGIGQMVQDYREKVRHTKLAVDDPQNLSADMVPGVRALATYVGTEQCVACHKTAATIWATSAHAHAFAALVDRKADADPRCIACHTVGFGDASGYRRDYGASKLVNVSCESCHGPGSLHVQEKQGDTSISFTFRPLDAGDCMKCHYGEFSRPFKWDLSWPQIQHGKEPLPAKP
jgi:Cytochrome c554 and c-prime